MSDKQYIERYWRDATPQDAIAEPPMVARFRDHDCDDWEVSSLLGFSRSSEEFPWFNKKDSAYYYCQVYDAPDPGEGWRLIDVEKEQPQVGDEIYEGARARWLVRSHTKPYDKTIIYRRRIEQPKPEPKYVPFKWEDREELRGRWICLGASEVQIQAFTNHDRFYINGICPEVLVRYWTFIDTGEPAGKKVTQ